MDRLGWHLLRVKGSHFQLGDPESPGVITVAIHATISRTAVRKTLKIARIDVDDFLRAL